MLINERKKYILEQIREKGGVSVEDLARKLGVSLMTIRRDLRKLSDLGLIERCHGGAVFKEEPYATKAISHKDEKNAIAKKAVSIIKDGDCIFLDAGTTTFQMLKFMEEYKRLTIVTNDLEIGYKASKMQAEVIIVGGFVQKSTACMYGMITNDMIKQLKFDISFIGAATIDEQFNVLTPTEQKAVYKKNVIKNSNQSYLLVDSSKFNKQAMIKVNNLKNYSGVITTYQFDSEEKQLILDKNISIIPVTLD